MKLRLFSWLLAALPWIEVALLGALVGATAGALLTLPAKAAAPCPLSSEGLLWTSKTDRYTIFVSNPTRFTIAFSQIRIRIQTRPDAGAVPDPADEASLTLRLPTTQAAPMAVTPVEFRADNIDPRSTIASGVICSAVGV